MSDIDRQEAIKRIKNGNATNSDYHLIWGTLTDEEYADKELQDLIDAYVDHLEG